MKGALQFSYSNGSVEGQINKLKYIKRSMYGRGSFELLRQRFLQVAADPPNRGKLNLLQDASADSFADWLKEHPSVELISRDRGTTFADGANRGAPQALQIADRWHVIQNLGEALEKVLARHHANLNQAFTPEEKQQVIATLNQEALAHIMARSQAEQQRQARQERRRATFTRVQELSTQGWSGASIARMLGIHKKTAVKSAAPLNAFPKGAAIVDGNWLPICRFCRLNGLSESTTLQFSIRLFVLKGTPARKRLYAIP